MHTFEEIRMRSLKEAVRLTALLHEPCAPDLASIHTGGDSIAFGQPEENMWPVNRMLFSRKLLRKLPDSVTTSHELYVR